MKTLGSEIVDSDFGAGAGTSAPQHAPAHEVPLVADTPNSLDIPKPRAPRAFASF